MEARNRGKPEPSTTTVVAQGRDVPGFSDILSTANKPRNAITKYSHRYDEQMDKRRRQASETVDKYYDLMTDFYEYGYGTSFHFAPVYSDKSFTECIKDYEHKVARSVRAKPGMELLDIGCGVGGPAREIAKFSGAKIIGLNCSKYQVKRARMHTAKSNQEDSISYVEGDYCDIKFADNSFDGVYAIGATPHTRSHLVVYKEVCRVLKPGGYFVDSTWALTDKYDPNNPDHVRIKNEIEIGNALVELKRDKEIVEAAQSSGLEVLEFKNLDLEADEPWYTFLHGRGCCSVQNFRSSAIGRMTTHSILTVLECMKLVPKGSTAVHSVLQIGANSLVESGKKNIYTTLLFIVARKPLD